MSRTVQIENLLRTIAQAASERQPLPMLLRERCGDLGAHVADALDQGQDVASALAGQVPEDLLAALRGPRPPLERSALLAAERLRLERQTKRIWLETLLHPLFTMLAVSAALVIILRGDGMGLSLPWLLAGLGVLGMCGALFALAWSRQAVWLLPSLASLGYHATQAQRFERAALVARWRLSEADLRPLLGTDLALLGPVLASPDAEHHCQRLAGYHAAAAVRARSHLAWLIGACIYITAGILLLSTAIAPVEAVIGAIETTDE